MLNDATISFTFTVINIHCHKPEVNFQPFKFLSRRFDNGGLKKC